MANDSFTSRMAYRAFFFGPTIMPGADQVWNVFAPFKHKFDAWLALRNRCWTADRLAHRGLPTNALCPLCGTDAETLDHLSLQCSFSAVVWATACRLIENAVPTPTAQRTLALWWPDAVQALSRRRAKEANSLVMLTLCRLWLERNVRVFDRCASTVATVSSSIREEWVLWLSCRRGPVRDIG
jgi:hypothetical protein